MPLWKVDKRNIFKNEIRFLEKEGAILLGQIQIQENCMNNKQNQNLKVDRYDLNELLPSFENSSNNWNKDRYALHFLVKNIITIQKIYLQEILDLAL